MVAAPAADAAMATTTTAVKLPRLSLLPTVIDATPAADVAADTAADTAAGAVTTAAVFEAEDGVPRQ
jgi:hypothetical protein